MNYDSATVKLTISFQLFILDTNEKTNEEKQTHIESEISL